VTRKRSKYRPKGVRLDVVKYVVEGLKPMALHPAATDLRIKNHAAMTSIVRGKGTRTDIDVVINALNIAEAFHLVDENLGRDWRPEISQAQDALFAMAQRGVEKGRFLFTGPELTAVNVAMEVHDAQLDRATVQQLEKATDVVYHTIRTKRARQIESKPTEAKQ
jgi:hypothetical protein